MDETVIPKKPFVVGNKRPQGVEILDADKVPLMLVYGETQSEARRFAERITCVLNETKDLF